MKVYVVGLGPGGLEQITPKALEVLEACDVIAGYHVYIDLIKERFSHKAFLVTAMTQEVARCQMAIDEALKGKVVAMVSSGDAGVYGMAGVMHEVAKNYKELEVEVIPGITAACSGAALMGAPLIHDFAVISLSDLLTPWDKIAKRVEGAALADFVICLYNPSSKKRRDYLQKACDLMLKHKSPDTPCGYAQHIGRVGETYSLCSLSELRETEVDMFTTVIIGNSQTEVIKGKLVTPRGYREVHEH